MLCRSYLASLHGRNDAVTISRKLSSLRAFFRLLVRRRLVAASPVAALRAPKRAHRLPAFLGKEDVGRLLDGRSPRAAPDSGKRATGRRQGGRPGARNSCATRRCSRSSTAPGLRVSEACNLDLADVESDGARREVKVRQGKGRKDRVVPVGAQGGGGAGGLLAGRGRPGWRRRRQTARR